MKSYYLLLIAILCIVSCVKDEVTEHSTKGRQGVKGLSVSTTLESDDDVFYDQFDGDSIERPTVLGGRLANPYSTSNMQQAYSNLGLSNYTVNATHEYVRFRPLDNTQLETLINYMEDRDMELFDTPVDYQVISEGDYYQDPFIPEDQITWQYCVVPKGFIFPSGIQRELVANIHIPQDDFSAVETEAERIAELGGGDPILSRIPQCLDGYHWDAVARKCVPNNCPADYHWDDELKTCVSNYCPNGYFWNGYMCQKILPPPPATDAAKPAGHLYVQDTQTGGAVPLKYVRVVARRWFKTKRGYTDNNGYFYLDKKFKNKVKIIVKFKNNDAQVRALRGVRLWQMFFPVKKKIAEISRGQAKNNINYTFQTNTNKSSKGNRYWSAATVHNSIQEYKQYATDENIGQAPTDMKIFITTLVNGGAAPMFAKRASDNLPQEYLTRFLLSSISGVAGGVHAILGVLKRQVDIAVGYGTLNSDRIKETMYHELTHAAHYNKVGESWYGQFVTAEIAAILSDNAPYGRKSGNNAGIIALGESWAYYMGHYMANKHYGNLSAYAPEQGVIYQNNWPVSGLASHYNLLEDFDPNRVGDPFNWIPQGLYYDLFDLRNDGFSPPFRFPLNDEVSGFTPQMLFNALQSSTSSLLNYKSKLIEQNIGNQTNGVNYLFNYYGY